MCFNFLFELKNLCTLESEMTPPQKKATKIISYISVVHFFFWKKIDFLTRSDAPCSEYFLNYFLYSSFCGKMRNLDGFSWPLTIAKKNLLSKIVEYLIVSSKKFNFWFFRTITSPTLLFRCINTQFVLGRLIYHQNLAPKLPTGLDAWFINSLCLFLQKKN